MHSHYLILTAFPLEHWLCKCALKCHIICTIPACWNCVQSNLVQISFYFPVEFSDLLQLLFCSSLIQVIRLSHKHYLDVLESALADGSTVLLENIGETVRMTKSHRTRIVSGCGILQVISHWLPTTESQVLS